MAAVVLAVFYAFSFSFSTKKIDFNTQVKPLLNRRCITCHGGVKKQGGFSLLFRQDALEKTESGKPALIPGDPDGSEMITRLTHHDPEERMPYKQDPLSTDEIKMLRQWVKEGAEWGDHWAFTEVKPVAIPMPRTWFGSTQKSDWAKNEIDYFILDKIKSAQLTAQTKGITPSVSADKLTLLRRVALDLVGIPASESLKNQFLNDNSPKAYENLVDSLLATPAYGERWTAMWLDIARYADTKGYERDDSRSIWRYRDWLIKAFNTDMPYNQFITEQMAGDLLPAPTIDQYLATAFHRNSMTNDEGGTDNEEFRIAAVMDRVSTTWQGVLGTTFACVQCHSHPYDPFRHEEYYKFMAFFNNTRDEDTYADYPILREYKKEDSLTHLELNGWLKNNAPQEADGVDKFVKTLQPSYNSLTADKFLNAALADEKWLTLRQNGSARFKNVDLTDKNQLLFTLSNKNKGGTLLIYLDSINGQLLTNITLDTSKNSFELFVNDFLPQKGTHDLYFQYSNPNLKNANDRGITLDWFHFSKGFPGKNLAGFDNARKQFYTLLKSNNCDKTPVLTENPDDMRRKTHVFDRGNWLTLGEEVQPDVPKSLNPFPQNAPRNRLGLAIWLTDKKNPLTARTYVNRIWEQIFGQGLAETLEDLGTQGIAPTHRELLDFLSYNFMHTDNWQTKTLLKKIVMSATYQQTSTVSPELLAKDPQNKLYARAPRVRLSAEQIRDQALFVSELLLDSLYGKSVFPYQPEGIWSSPWNGSSWRISDGKQQYRRAIYTYWKRSSPYPSMLTFDGVNREICVSRRIRTNTPLQALVTLNDSTFIVAAVEMAKKAAFSSQNLPQTEANWDNSALSNYISKIYERALGQSISTEKRLVLEKLYQTALHEFSSKNKKDIAKLPSALSKQPPEIAALAVVANAILNLDEFINKS